MYNTLIKSRTI